MQGSTAEQRERLRLRMASMASHEACHAAIASLRRGSLFSTQQSVADLRYGSSHAVTLAQSLLCLTCCLKCNTKRNVIGVTREVRSHGNAERGRGAGCKSWLMKNVTRI